ncbi:MAG: 4-hydroxythreonine-4-phosphate dehydrogenase PdxA, partial [Pseudoruegeria sp.]
MSKPRIAIVPGDPSGIGPELIARLLNEEGTLEAADIVLVGDSHLWQQGAEQADLPVVLNAVEETNIADQSGLSHLEMETVDKDDVKISEVTIAGGTTSLRCLDKALDLAQAGLVDGVLFAPFNKAAMTSAGLNAEDEHKYMARYLGFEGYHSEINVLDELMTTRVTS